MKYKFFIKVSINPKSSLINLCIYSNIHPIPHTNIFYSTAFSIWLFHNHFKWIIVASISCPHACLESALHYSEPLQYECNFSSQHSFQWFFIFINWRMKILKEISILFGSHEVEVNVGVVRIFFFEFINFNYFLILFENHKKDLKLWLYNLKLL